MNWVDIVIVLLVAAAGYHGWRTGAAVQVLGFGGFWLGLALGVLAAAPIAALVSGTLRTWVTLLVLFAAAGLLGALGRVLGARAASALRLARLGVLDALVGVAVAVAATLAVLWLLGALLAVGPSPVVGRAIQKSRIERALDRVFPTVPTLFARVESFLSENGMPVVFVDLPPGLVAPVALPRADVLQPAVRAARPSVVEIRGAGCGVLRLGSGFVVAPGVVVTNAHVVAGVAHPEVLDGTGDHGATAIGFDARLDVAVLRVPGLSDPPLALHDAIVGRGSGAAALGFPGGGGFASTPAGVNAAFLAVGLDIYGTSVATRDVYELHAAIVPGDSGGPLVAASVPGVRDGTAIGLVFARSATNDDVGYALAMPAVEDAVRAAEAAATPVSTGACLP